MGQFMYNYTTHFFKEICITSFSDIRKVASAEYEITAPFVLIPSTGTNNDSGILGVRISIHISHDE
jgi:hypothetical protein